MACCHLLLFPCVVPANELAAFIESEGGVWVDEDSPPAPQGCITIDDRFLFVRGVRTQADDLRFCTSTDLETAAGLCGRPIVAVLTVDHSKSIDHKHVNAVIQRITERWGGCEV